MITLDQGNTPCRRCQDVGRQGPHAGTDLHKMIPLPRFQIGNDGLCKIRIEEEILTEHFARTHTNLVETGAEFCLGHGTMF